MISPLYSACGPRGDDTAVSLLLKIGLPVNEVERCAVTRNGCHTRRTALYRALANNRLSAVKMLLRSKASVGWRGGEFEHTSHGRAFANTPIRLALKMAERSGGEGALRILLGHRICPFMTPHAYTRGISFDTDVKDVNESSGLTYSGVLTRVLSTCEPRCHNKKCEMEIRMSLACTARSTRKRELSP